MATEITLKPIGVIRSEIKNLEDAPLFYTEGAPNAILEMLPEYLDGLHRMKADKIIFFFHQVEN